MELAEEIADLAERARSRKLDVKELKGSTITITNIGPFGGQFFTPIINYPEVAILGVGTIAEKPVARDGKWCPADVVGLPQFRSPAD